MFTNNKHSTLLYKRNNDDMKLIFGPVSELQVKQDPTLSEQLTVTQKY